MAAHATGRGQGGGVLKAAAARTGAASQRFAVLDGLRGIAAIAVVIYHTSFLRHVEPDVLPSAYLAVDCFFIMSGFVLCRAYHGLLEQGRVWTFMRKRWTRLAPIWWVGLVLCLAELVAMKFAPNPALAVGELVVNAAMLPLPLGAKGELFRLNLPGWSLFYELVINLAYAVVGYRLGVRGLALVMAAGAVALITLTRGMGGTDGGALLSELPIALARVTYGFLAGALLYRLQLPMIGNSIAASLFACTLVILVFAVEAAGDTRWYYDIAMTLVVLPLVVTIGTTFDAPPPLRGLFDFIGKASYPLYAIHWPAFALAQQVYGRLMGWSAVMPFSVIVVLVGSLIVVAYYLAVLIDPIAGRFGRSLEGKRAAPPAAGSAG